MGFWDIAGEFAKEFGKGYVKERGVKGTLEDISELFSSDDDDDDEKEFDEQVWSDTVDEINSCIEEEQYSEAIDTLVTYYNNYEVLLLLLVCDDINGCIFKNGLR